MKLSTSYIYNTYVNMYAQQSTTWGTETEHIIEAPTSGFEKVFQCDLHDLSLCGFCFEAEQNNSCDPFCFQADSQTWKY